MDGPLQAGQSLYFAVAQQTAATLETHLIICHSYVASTWIIKILPRTCYGVNACPTNPLFLDCKHLRSYHLISGLVRNFNPWAPKKKVTKPYACQVIALQKSLIHLCINNNSKSHRCQSPVAPVRTRPLTFISLLHSNYYWSNSYFRSFSIEISNHSPVNR